MGLPSRTYQVIHVGLLNKSRLDFLTDDDDEVEIGLFVVCDAVDECLYGDKELAVVRESLLDETSLNIPDGCIVDLKDKIMFPIDLIASDYFVAGDFIHIQDTGEVFFKKRFYPRGIDYDTTLH